MPTELTSQTLTTSHPSRALIIAAAIGGGLCAATLALWAHYGSTVFYEMIVAGMAACF
jgi:hypothetical protein